MFTISPFTEKKQTDEYQDKIGWPYYDALQDIVSQKKREKKNDMVQSHFPSTPVSAYIYNWLYLANNVRQESPLINWDDKNQATAAILTITQLHRSNLGLLIQIFFWSQPRFHTITPSALRLNRNWIRHAGDQTDTP